MNYLHTPEISTKQPEEAPLELHWGFLRFYFACPNFTMSKHVKTKDFFSLTKDISVSVQLQKEFNYMVYSQVTRC